MALHQRAGALEDSAKAVHLCENNGTLAYTFGPWGGQPELELRVPLRKARIEPWNGMGHEYWAPITIPSGQWAYRLGFSVSRGPDAKGGYAGITVVRDGKEVRNLACHIDTLSERIESLPH